eukprot:TRINITY_DN11004_c0_g1_i2.p1 TRINITY_DN11004_c0_g1~~TRINITY_DN11004_c0_g1_i2.p1  ORF type:complete len:105 (-),score=15.11 TRINITY_DN11004_c0_g1_i2:773-1087(-)
MTSLSPFYSSLLASLQSLLSAEEDIIANLANVSSVLFHDLNHAKNDTINWVGFYINRKGELVLGPFQGKLACTRIKMGKGVCGTAAITKNTQVFLNSTLFLTVP